VRVKARFIYATKGAFFCIGEFCGFLLSNDYHKC